MDLYHNLIDLVENNNKDDLDKLFNRTYWVDIATVLERFEDQEILQFYKLARSENMAEVLAKSSRKLQLRILKLLDYKETISIFSYMSNDDIADILGDLPIGMRKELLKLMKEDETSTIEELLGYNTDTAGGIMTTEYIALSGNLTTMEALKKVKEI